MFINNISVSKENTFYECRLKYNYKYIKYLKEDEENSDAMQFGSFIHKVFELGVKASKVEDLQIIAETIKNNYKFSKVYQNKINICLTNFFNFNKNITNTLSTEFEYKIIVDEANDISINGIIDRIISGKDGSILILDYKTGKNEKTKVDLFFDKQLKGYAYAVHKMYNIPLNKITVGHYYPLTNNLVTLAYTEQDVLRNLKETIETVWRIRKAKSEDFKASRNKFCNYCGYKKICPEWNDPVKCNLLLEHWPKQEKKK